MPTYTDADDFARACALEAHELAPLPASHNRGREFIIGTVAGYQLIANGDGWTMRLNGVLVSQREGLGSPLTNLQGAVAYLNPREVPRPPPTTSAPAHEIDAGAILQLAKQVTTAGGGMLATQALVDGTRVTVLVLGKTVGRTPTPSEIEAMLAAQVAAYIARTAP